MQFNVSQLLKEGIGAERTYNLDESIEPLAETHTTWVGGAIRLVRTEKGLWLTGQVRTNAVGSCSRCLEDFSYSLTFQVDDEWFPSVDVMTGVRLPLPERKGEVFTIDEHHILDFREAVRQYTLVNVPMKPLCRQDCPGICPGCGAQRKYEKCQCKVERVDPRWGPLLDLLAQNPG